MKPVDLESRPALGFKPFKGVIGDWRLAMRGTSASAQALVSALKPKSRQDCLSTVVCWAFKNFHVKAFMH